MTAYRYAIYYAPPPQSALWRLGSAWLGRDAATGGALARPELTGIGAAEIRAITREPARYGFHATLKPPFRLRDGATENELISALEGFAAARAPVPIPPLVVSSIAQFVALLPATRTDELLTFAAECVETFDRFRGPTETAELTRRREAKLTQRQDELLQRWGYPYVMDEYRFHMTLTGPLAPADRDRIRPALAACFEPMTAEPLTIDAVTLFGQPAENGPFRIIERLRLQAGE